MSCFTLVCRDMGRETALCVPVEASWIKIQSAGTGGALGIGAMNQLAHWLLSLAVDAQRARDATFPPILQWCCTRWWWWPRCCLPGSFTMGHFARLWTFSPGCWTMRYGAQVLPERAFLDRPLEVTPAVLAMELEDIHSEFRTWTKTPDRLAATSPGTLGRRDGQAVACRNTGMPGVHLL